ncbi:MAG: alpha/beta hydrolase [Solirubrobacterales bacterium]|nr:alpha/beta hydrolase [Solirubrobacterales bacterium]
MLILHGAGVDHREAEASFQPALGTYGGLRRIYPDLRGMGQTPAPAALRSADDVLEILLGFGDEVVGQEPTLLVGHSAGGYYGQGFAARRPDRVVGLALVCPLLAGMSEVPEHRPVIAADDLGDEGFRSYFVVQTPAMLERYLRFVAPASPSPTWPQWSESASAGSSPCPMARRTGGRRSSSPVDRTRLSGTRRLSTCSSTARERRSRSSTAPATHCHTNSRTCWPRCSKSGSLVQTQLSKRSGRRSRLVGHRDAVAQADPYAGPQAHRATAATGDVGDLALLDPGGGRGRGVAGSERVAGEVFGRQPGRPGAPFDDQRD